MCHGSGNTLSDVIYIGDNFTVNVEHGNSKGVDFYLLKCTISKQCATHNIVDASANVYLLGHSTSKVFFMQGWMNLIMFTSF